MVGTARCGDRDGSLRGAAAAPPSRECDAAQPGDRHTALLLTLRCPQFLQPLWHLSEKQGRTDTKALAKSYTGRCGHLAG